MRHRLAVMAAFALMTGVAVAQGTPGSGSSTTTVTSGPNGSSQTPIKSAGGSSETHSKTEIDPASGGTTTSKTPSTRP